MRHTEQLPFVTPWICKDHAQALALISEIIDAHPQCATLVQQDLFGGVRHPGRGAPGMGAAGGFANRATISARGGTTGRAAG